MITNDCNRRGRAMEKDRETIDIEALIVRAYREKAVHRHRRVGALALGLTEPKALGGGFSAEERVDTSSFSARAAARTRELQAQLAAAPDVLLDLHAAVLDVPDFYIERTGGLDFVVWDVETAARLGHRIEVDAGKGASIVKIERRGGRGRGRDFSLPVDAPRRLTALTTSTIVILHGQHGDRPYVPDVVVQRMRPVYRGRHKEAIDYVPVYETGAQEMVEARATYAVWHAALGILASAMAGAAEVEVTAPAVPAEPRQAPRSPPFPSVRAAPWPRSSTRAATSNARASGPTYVSKPASRNTARSSSAPRPSGPVSLEYVICGAG